MRPTLPNRAATLTASIRSDHAADDPERLVLDFLEATYAAAATGGAWPEGLTASS